MKRAKDLKLNNLVLINDIKQILLENCSVDLKTKCLEWKGPYSKSNYGVASLGKDYFFNSKPKSFKAHRISYVVFHEKDLINGLFVCHKCDNPKCINPNHLFAGTCSENALDRIKKGRGYPPIQPRDLNNKTKIKSWQIPELLDKIRSGVKHLELAKEYGVCVHTITNIKKDYANVI